MATTCDHQFREGRLTEISRSSCGDYIRISRHCIQCDRNETRTVQMHGPFDNPLDTDWVPIVGAGVDG